MDDYISREAAIDAVDVGNLHHGIIDALQSIISDIPSADVVEVVRGTWLFGRGDVCKCSNCGWETSGRKAMRVNFCPNCGADMRCNND